MPYDKRCATRAMEKNVAKCIREGGERSQCAAIGYATLKRACGVKTKRRLTPKQIVRRRSK